MKNGTKVDITLLKYHAVVEYTKASKTGRRRIQTAFFKLQVIEDERDNGP